MVLPQSIIKAKQTITKLNLNIEITKQDIKRDTKMAK